MKGTKRATIDAWKDQIKEHEQKQSILEKYLEDTSLLLEWVTGNEREIAMALKDEVGISIRKNLCIIEKMKHMVLSCEESSREMYERWSSDKPCNDIPTYEEWMSENLYK